MSCGIKDENNESKKYNGWSNYETWVTNLWLSNELPSCDYLRSLANDRTIKDYDKDQILKDYVEEMMPRLEASLASDLLTSALIEVNWKEIIDDAKEELKNE